MSISSSSISYSTGELFLLSRRHLQQLCKRDDIVSWKNIKANAKSSEIIAELSEYFSLISNEEEKDDHFIQSPSISFSSSSSLISGHSLPSESPVLLMPIPDVYYREDDRELETVDVEISIPKKRNSKRKSSSSSLNKSTRDIEVEVTDNQKLELNPKMIVHNQPNIDSISVTPTIIKTEDNNIKKRKLKLNKLKKNKKNPLPHKGEIRCSVSNSPLPITYTQSISSKRSVVPPTPVSSIKSLPALSLRPSTHQRMSSISSITEGNRSTNSFGSIGNFSIANNNERNSSILMHRSSSMKLVTPNKFITMKRGRPQMSSITPGKGLTPCTSDITIKNTSTRVSATAETIDEQTSNSIPSERLSKRQKVSLKKQQSEPEIPTTIEEQTNTVNMIMSNPSASNSGAEDVYSSLLAELDARVAAGRGSHSQTTSSIPVSSVVSTVPPKLKSEKRYTSITSKYDKLHQKQQEQSQSIVDYYNKINKKKTTLAPKSSTTKQTNSSTFNSHNNLSATFTTSSQIANSVNNHSNKIPPPPNTTTTTKSNTVLKPLSSIIVPHKKSKIVTASQKTLTTLKALPNTTKRSSLATPSKHYTPSSGRRTSKKSIEKENFGMPKSNNRVSIKSRTSTTKE